MKELLETRGRKQNTVEDFYRKINKTDSCWLWMGKPDKDGYGKFTLNKKRQRAHRISYKLNIGPIPEDKPQILHHCDNPPCVRPEHLYAGTNKENMRDKVTRNRASNQNKFKTTCPRGHEYDTFRKKKNGKTERRCKTCDKISKASK